MKKIISCLLSALVILSVMAFLPVAASDNLCLGKPTTALSTATGVTPEAVTDGNYRSIWYRGNYGSAGEWIQVDLQDTYVLTEVVLHTRLDATGNDPTSQKYRTKVNIWLSNDPEFKTYDEIVGLPDEDPGYGVPVSVKPPKKAYRYIRAVKTDAFIFVLAEIEAFGYPSADLEGAPPEYEDVIGSKYETPITLLGNLGAVTGMNETMFGVNNLLTRAQAADMAVRAFMQNYSGAGSVPFPDVTADTPYYDSIVKAYQLGYVKGDENGRYNPAAYVTQHEFATIVLRAMGHGAVLERARSQASAVSSLTKELKLFKNVDMEEPLLSCGEAVIILYNALLADTLSVSFINDTYWDYTKSDVLLIESLYDFKLYEGVVTETRKFHLNGDTKAINSKVTVGGYALSDPDGKLNAYLGKKVLAGAYLDENNAVSLVLPHEDNQEVTVPARDVLSTSRGEIEVINEDGKTDGYDLSDTVDVLYNGAPDVDFEADSLKPKSGSITLIDNNDDGVYEVVSINSYDAYYVLGAHSDGAALSVVDEQNQTHSFDTDYLTISTPEGYPSTASSIKSGAVVKVYRAKNSEEAKIVIFSKPNFTGKVTAYSGEDVTVSGSTYRYAYGYFDMDTQSPELNKTTAVYLDEFGDVLWLREDTGANNTDWTMGFSTAFIDNGGLDSSLQFKIFTQNGIFVTPMAADKLLVDGTYMTRDEFSKNLFASSTFADYFTCKLLRFKLNSEGELSAIDSQNTSYEETGITFKEEGFLGSCVYTSANQAFWDYHTFLTMAKSTTPVFIVPVVQNAAGEASFTSDPAYDSFYEISTVISVAGDRGHKTQNLHIYMKDEEGFPACFMYKTSSTQAPSGNTTTVQSNSAPFMLVDRVTKVSDGYSIRGINIQTGAETSFVAGDDIKLVESGKIYADKDGDTLARPASAWFSGDARRINVNTLNTASEEERAKYVKDIQSISFGDIIRYELRAGTAWAVERVFAYEPNAGAPTQVGNVWLSVEGAYPEYILAYNRFQFSKFTGFTGNIAAFDVNGNEEDFVKTDFQYVYRCDPERKTLVKEDIGNLYGYMAENQRTMVYNYVSKATGVIVYEYK